MKLYPCPFCAEPQPATHFACRSGKKGGSATSDAKTKAARANAKRPRPRKEK